MKIYISVVMVIGTFFTVTGLWFIYNPRPMVKLPDEDPVIFLDVREATKGTIDQIEIFDDGTIYYLMERCCDKAKSNFNPVRIWKKGNITEDELEPLMDWIHTRDFLEIYQSYEFCSQCVDSLEAYGNQLSPEMSLILYINCQDVSKTITASGNVIPETGMSHPDTPYALRTIYDLVMNIGETMTEEIHREVISSTMGY